MKIRAAAFQMEVGEAVRENVGRISRAVRRAAAEKADILLTPEGSLSGYTPHFNAEEVRQGLQEITSLAAGLRVGLALGTCFQESDGLTYNQVRFYSRDGHFLGFHSKILRCGSMTDPPEGEINDYAASELKVFSFENCVVGGLICNDLWANPGCTPMPDVHLSQQLSKMGAQIIFHAVNGGRNGSSWTREVNWAFHESNLRMRAAAGKVWIVTVDNAAPVQMPCSAPGGVINPSGEWACRADPQGEQFFVHTIEVAE
jgi:predicted amidohydrolase